MMKTEHMSRLEIIGPKIYLKKAISKLYDLNVYHIQDHKKSDEFDIGNPLEHSERLAEIIVKIRAVISYLGIEKNGIRLKEIYKELAEKDFYELGRKSKELYNEVTKNIDMIKQANEEIPKIDENIKMLGILNSLNIKESMLKESNAVQHFIGELKKTKGFVEGLNSITTRCDIEDAVIEGKHYIALFVDKKKAENVSGLLARHDFVPLELSISGSNIGSLQKRKSELSEKRGMAEDMLKKIKEENKAFLLTNERLLAEEIKKTQAPLRFGATKDSFFITGYVPTKKVPQAKRELEEITNNKIYIKDAEPGEKENVPVKLKNSRLVKPFEFFLDMYAYPKYRELDPTFMLFLTFPLFFGIMLGDVGYGIVTFILFLALRMKLPNMKPLLNVMILASLVTIVFGIGFGEYLGFEHLSEEKGEALCNAGFCLHKETIEVRGEQHTIYDFPRILDRPHGTMNVFGFEILSVLIIGAIIGFFHLNLALLLGFFNELKKHGLKAAILEKISWMVMELGVILMALAMTKAVPFKKWVWIVPLVGGIAMIAWGEGVKGMIELPAIFSNMLSYMRLGAVGLASVGLAVVINEQFLMPFMEKGGIFILFGIIIFVIGHLINIALGIIGPFLHSLRLHYVEFFSKFYEGGGKLYDPFGLKTNGGT